MIIKDLISNEPSFSSWPISDSLKTTLIHETGWPAYFSRDSNVLARDLHNISQELQDVNFFNNPSETSWFFSFLRGLVESRPSDNRVLREFSEITVAILDKLSLESRFYSKQERVVIHYLELLQLMLAPSYRYLFNKPEIDAWTNDFQKISDTPFNSSEQLSQFRNTLQLTFQTRAFVNNYPALIRTISELAHSLDKAQMDSNALEAMKLFDSLGALDHTLKTSRIHRLRMNQTAIHQSIQATRQQIYREFKPYVEENFLKFIVFKLYLAQSFPNSTNLTELCDSETYQSQCQSDYIRYGDNYSYTSGQSSDFSIDIKNNNRSRSDLIGYVEL